MVLGSQVRSLTYPQTLYYSGKWCSIRYIPGSLTMDPGAWDDADNRFLAALYNLTYKRLHPDELPVPENNYEEVWGRYWRRILRGLTGGSAVQICQGWMFDPSESDWLPPWWGGMSERPDVHYIVAGGVDFISRNVNINDPIDGWFGQQGKDKSIPFDTFTEMIDRCGVGPNQYITITYSGEANEIPHLEVTVINRIGAKILGMKSQTELFVYEDDETWLQYAGMAGGSIDPDVIVYGTNGLRHLCEDLEDDIFPGVIDSPNNLPYDMVAYLDLSIYHYSQICAVASEFLEYEGRIDEWEWMQKLHMLYERMWLSSAYIRDTFKMVTDSPDNLGTVINESAIHRANLRDTIIEVIRHLETHPGVGYWTVDPPSPLILP